jgi:hypothetical protein
MQVKNGIGVVPFKYNNGRWQIFLQTRDKKDDPNDPDNGKLEVPCETIEFNGVISETEYETVQRCLIEEVNPKIERFQLYNLDGSELTLQTFSTDSRLPDILMTGPVYRMNTQRNGVNLSGTCVMAELHPDCQAAPHNEAINPVWIDVLRVERMAKQNPQNFTYTIGAILIACATLKRKPLIFSI